MSLTLYSGDASNLWLQMLRALLERGEHTQPRGMGTVEVRPAMLTLLDPQRRWVEWKKRKLAVKLGVMEGLLLIAGRSEPELLKAVAPQYKRFINPATGGLDGAYGPRVAEQMPYILRLLDQDPDTRQAVATIYGPQDHHASLDVPCTISLQFFIRNGKLELVTYMRSNDAWLGWPYDVVQFTLLQEAAANHLGLGLGPYTHVDGSLHLYDRDADKARAIAEAEGQVLAPVVQPPLMKWTFSAA